MNKIEETIEFNKNYRVLARKYRPINFSTLIGQDALVKTISGSIKRGRIAHAFILHGVRGVGKTTTARILAKIFNCEDLDFSNNNWVKPCETCNNCKNISLTNHVDVIEMDAASHTGVDNIRELIDGVGYKPIESKFRIYIIDEVHMLSKGAFNALLKTLEEPPEHVKFIFATTEIKKVPVTILSRCQRFDLKRVSVTNLISHLEYICNNEKISFDNESLGLIARSSDGSVRDALSILDQASAMMNDNLNSKEITTMLGLPDSLLSINILKNALNGEIRKCLEIFENYIISGGNGESVLNDCLGVVHLITRYSVLGKENICDPFQTFSDFEKEELTHLSKIRIQELIRAWQIIIKGIEEIKLSPDGDKSASMVLIRLAYASSLPEPGEIINKIKLELNEKKNYNDNKNTENFFLKSPKSFDELVNLFKEKGEKIIYANIASTFHLVSFEPGNVSVRLSGNIDKNFLNNIEKKLIEWTNEKWTFNIVNEGGQDTIEEKNEKDKLNKFEEAKNSIEMKKVFETFPKAELKSIKEVN